MPLHFSGMAQNDCFIPTLYYFPVYLSLFDSMQYIFLLNNNTVFAVNSFSFNFQLHTCTYVIDIVG